MLCMARKRKELTPPKRFTKNRIIIMSSLAVVASALGYFVVSAMIPANGTAPVFGLGANHYIKAAYSSRSGYTYVSQSSGAVKGVKNTGNTAADNPTYIFNKGELESIHFINEDYETHSLHNFNIDEFNIHTSDLGYFTSQTVTFVADKPGTYHYYCSIHPEMKGDIEIK